MAETPLAVRSAASQLYVATPINPGELIATVAQLIADGIFEPPGRRLTSSAGTLRPIEFAMH
jgi:hypothetical protein